MMVRVRHVSPAAFGFVVLCFLLPFVTLSCPGGSFTFSGVQLATGTTIEEPGLFGLSGRSCCWPSRPRLAEMWLARPAA